MKRFLPLFAILVAITLGASRVSFVHAQSTGVQKAFESVKESLDSLVSAKDERQPTELSLRIETFRKVLDLSLAEAKDTRVKLLELEDLKGGEEAWRDISADTMKDAADYLQTQEQYLDDNEKTLSVDDVKSLAKDFKDWREKNYLPTFSAVRDYFLVMQQAKTIDTAKKRWQKIDADVARLEKARIKKIASAREMLTSAEKVITESEKLNDNARTLFFATYIPETTSTATSSAETSTSTAVKLHALTILASDTATSSTADNASTTATSTATSTDAADVPGQVLPPSVRDEVKSSLSKIRDAYNIFIDMSTLVRKLLK